MSVILDAVASVGLIQAGGTALTFNTQTVGTGPNRLLVVCLSFDFAQGVTAATWDFGGSNQVMTQVIGNQQGGIGAYIYALLNPVSGNKTLKVTWTIDSGDVSVDTLSLYNVDQSGLFSTSVYNGTINSGINSSPGQTITANPSDYVVDVASNGAGNGLAGGTGLTELYHVGSTTMAAAAYGTGHASYAVSYIPKITPTGQWTEAGIAIKSAPNFSFSMAGI